MRKLLAVWAAKLAGVAGRLIGKKSSSSPGVLALKICPDLIRQLSKNIRKGIIVTCGTNGKTTTNNLLNTVLQKRGYTTVCNRLGANMLGGIATAFTDACNLFGTFSADYAVLEIDEASARRVFAHLTPNYMIITNLFRDQLDRYGEIDITMDLLREAIDMAGDVTLILNGDDPLTASLGEGRHAVYFGISEQVLPQIDETKEGRFCAKCGKEQEYRFFHYSQLGDYYCPHCHNRRPDIDFDARNVDLSASMKFTVNGRPLFRFAGGLQAADRTDGADRPRQALYLKPCQEPGRVQPGHSDRHAGQAEKGRHCRDQRPGKRRPRRLLAMGC